MEIFMHPLYSFFLAVFPAVGISQSYISQWLLQQGLEMSDSKRRAFYRWYLLERNSPGEYSWPVQKDGVFSCAKC